MPSSAPAGRRPDPSFVGRGDEVARLSDVLTSARAGQASLSLILGEAGIGKSRLAGRIAAEADAMDFEVLWTEAEDGCGPFAALSGLRIAHANQSDGSGDDLRWERLDDLAAGIAGRAPVLVIVEDLHWSDASSLWVVERLARHLSGVPVAILGTARDDEVDADRLAGLLAAAENIVRLTGLTRAETAELAALAAPRTVLDEGGLWERTGGIPLFVREAAVLAADGGGSSVTASVLRRRIARLDAEVARALAAIALAPHGTSLTEIATALQVPITAVTEAVDAARAEGLVTDKPGVGVRFRHALLAEAAGAVLDPTEQSRLHVALAEVFDSAGGPAARVVRQRLLALPAGDVRAVAEAAVAAVVELRASEEGAEASALAELAAAAVARYGAAPELVGRLHVERGESLFALGDAESARVAFDAAINSAPRDPDVRARGETGRAWFANPFLPEPETMRRLTDAVAALRPEDSPLRVRLLGRIAVVSLALAAARDIGRSAGVEAVEMARRLDDPATLVQALADRHLAPDTPEQWALREQAADEIAALGERLSRPEVAVLGYEWQYGARLGRADVCGAERALDRLELASHLIASPRWRFSAALRRATLLSLNGERDRALGGLVAALETARAWLQPAQAIGVEAGFRMGVAFLHSEPDPRLTDLLDLTDEVAASQPVGFIQASLAFSSLMVGDVVRARSYFDRTVQALPDIAVGLESLFGLNLCGLVAAHLEDVSAAQVIRPLLEPFVAQLTAGSGAVVAPVATTLGLLATLSGDTVAARDFHAIAAEVAQRTGSQLLVERCRSLASRPRFVESAPASASGKATITSHAAGWSLISPVGSADVADSRGMQQLVEILRAGGRGLSALDLAGTDGAKPVQSDLGPMLDGRAKREYRARIAELRDDIEDAEALHDPDRASLARLELDALLNELRRAVGLDGRDRPQGSTSERARVNVTRSIRRAIATVAATAPELGAHLEVSVRTGRECSYRPDPAAALVWEVSTRS